MSGKKDAPSACFVLSFPAPTSSVEFLQHRGNVHQAELAAKVTDDGGVVEHEQLPDALAVAALAEVDRLQQVAEVQVPEGDAALAPRHQEGLGDHPQAGPATQLLGRGGREGGSEREREGGRE